MHMCISQLKQASCRVDTCICMTSCHVAVYTWSQIYVYIFAHVHIYVHAQFTLTHLHPTCAYILHVRPLKAEPKMVPKSQNGPKMVPKIVPKWSQNGSKMVSKWSQIGPARREKYHQQYDAKPGNRDYCGLRPLGVQLDIGGLETEARIREP